MTLQGTIDGLLKTGIILEGGCTESRKNGPYYIKISNAYVMYNAAGYVAILEDGRCILLNPKNAEDAINGIPVDGIL